MINPAPRCRRPHLATTRFADRSRPSAAHLGLVLTLALAGQNAGANQGDVESGASDSEVAAKEAAPPPRVKLLVTNLSATGVEVRVASAVTKLIASEIAKTTKYDVMSGDDLRRMVELEAERERVGCDNDASCLAEVAGALGAQRVVFGDISRLGSAMIVSLTLLDSVAATSIGRVTAQIEGEGALAAAVPDLVARLFGRKAPVPTPSPERTDTAEDPVEDEASGGFPVVAVSTMAIGIAAVVGGVIAVGVGLYPLVSHAIARGNAEAIELTGTLDDLDEAKSLQGQQEQFDLDWQSYGMFSLAGGVAAVVVGGVAAAGGGILFALDGDSE